MPKLTTSPPPPRRRIRRFTGPRMIPAGREKGPGMPSHYPETTGGIRAGMADRTGREITLRMTGNCCYGESLPGGATIAHDGSHNPPAEVSDLVDQFGTSRSLKSVLGCSSVTAALFTKGASRWYLLTKPTATFISSGGIVSKSLPSNFRGRTPAAFCLRDLSFITAVYKPLLLLLGARQQP